MVGVVIGIKSNCRDWTKGQYNASYKGVLFEVETDSRETGRAVVTHTYPTSEFWDNEDLGRLPSVVTVEAYIARDDADSHSQELLAACSSFGPGLLVLPNRPPAMASCRTVASEWTADAMGRMSAPLEFVLESASQGGIVSVTMLVSAVIGAVKNGLSAVGYLFDSNFNTLMRRFSPVSFVPGVARDAAADTIRKASDELRDAFNAIRVSNKESAAAIDFAIRDLSLRALELAYQGQLADHVDREGFVASQITVAGGLSTVWVNALNLISSAAVNAKELSSAMLVLSNFVAQDTTPGPNCLSVRAEKALAEEVAALVRRTALMVYAKAATALTFDNRSEAIDARGQISAAFAIEMMTVGDPQTENEILKVRDTTLDLLTQSGSELPRVTRMQSKVSLPAAVLATMLYNDASKDVTLIDRNLVNHPNFMPLIFEVVK